MKRLVLLLALASAAAQAKTVVMDCGTPGFPDLYRYTSDPTPKYEWHFAFWSDFCVPSEEPFLDKRKVTTCKYRNGVAVQKVRTEYQSKGIINFLKDSRILDEMSWTITIDFVRLRKTDDEKTVTCTRLESD